MIKSFITLTQLIRPSSLNDLCIFRWYLSGWCIRNPSFRSRVNRSLTIRSDALPSPSLCSHVLLYKSSNCHLWVTLQTKTTHWYFLSPDGVIVFSSALPQMDCERRCSLFSSFFFLFLNAFVAPFSAELRLSRLRAVFSWTMRSACAPDRQRLPALSPSAERLHNRSDL